jgi:hypothetical protein
MHRWRLNEVSEDKASPEFASKGIQRVSGIKIRVNASGQGLKTPALPVAGLKTPLWVANIGLS